MKNTDTSNVNKCVNVKNEKGCYIDGTIYIVQTFFSEKSKQTVTQKLEKIMLNELDLKS